MSYFPFFIDLDGRECLIAGGGNVAFRKARTLLEFGAHIHMVAPDFSEDIVKLYEDNAESGRMSIDRRLFCEDDLEDVLFVIAATDNDMVNDRISIMCRNRNILVNVVDDKEKCGFYFPSIVKCGEIVVGVSSGGNSPVLARNIRRNIEKTIPEYYEQMNEKLGNIREFVKATVKEESDRKKCFETLVSKCDDSGVVPDEEEMKKMVAEMFEEND